MRQRQIRLQTNCPAMLHLADKNIVQDAGIFNGIVAPCRKRDHKICQTPDDKTYQTLDNRTYQTLDNRTCQIPNNTNCLGKNCHSVFISTVIS